MAAKKNAIVTADDPLVRLSKEELDELKRPQLVVDEALKSKSLGEVFAYGKVLNKISNVSGLNKAQLLYLLRESWAKFQAEGAVEDDFESVIEAEFGMTPANIKKYADAWAALIAQRRIPDKFVGAWMHKPVESWLAIRAAAVDGLSLKKWEEATVARKPADVKRLVRSVRGHRTSSKNALVIKVKRGKSGELVARRGSGAWVTVGLLKLDAKSQANELIKAATDRILAGAGILLE